MGRKLTGQHSLCRACGEYFNSVAAFDKHRQGDYSTNRCCLTPAEMLEKGMAKNAADWWVTSLRENGPVYPSSKSIGGDLSENAPLSVVG